jgi:cell division protein FtsL
MYGFIKSSLKFAILAWWIVIGAVGILAARHNTRLLDASQAELAAYRLQASGELASLRRQVNDATNELGQFRDQLAQSVVNVEAYRLEAAKWRTKFDAICAQVSQIAQESSEPVLTVVSE